MLQTLVKSPVYERSYGDAPYLDAVLVENEAEGTLTLFAVNKSLEEGMEISCDLRQFAGYQVAEQSLLTQENLKAVNTEQDPFQVRPVSVGNAAIEGGRLTAVLPKQSWNVIRLEKRA